jgi:hypothetical protein
MRTRTKATATAAMAAMALLLAETPVVLAGNYDRGMPGASTRPSEGGGGDASYWSQRDKMGSPPSQSSLGRGLAGQAGGWADATVTPDQQRAYQDSGYDGAAQKAGGIGGSEPDYSAGPGPVGPGGTLGGGTRRGAKHGAKHGAKKGKRK